MPERRLPVIHTREGLKDVLKLRILHLLDVAGAGVLMHRRRVVDIGEADVAFVAWRAEEDAVGSVT